MSEINIINKVKKLLALASDNGSTKNEAETAMRMVSVLMMKHNLSNADIADGVKSDIWYTIIPIGVIKNWHKSIGNAVSRLNSTRFAFNTAHRICIFYGSEDNRIASKLLFEFLIEESKKEYKLACPTSIKGNERQKFRNSFLAACSKILSIRAYKIVNSWRTDDTTAMVDIGVTSLTVVAQIDKQLHQVDEFIKNEFGKIKEAKQRKLLIGVGTYEGIVAGGRIKLQESIQN